MRTLAVTQNMTIDGRIEMLDDWFEPGDQDTGMVAAMNRIAEAEDDLILGRRIFEAFRGYWPQQTDDTTGFTDHLNRVRRCVVSSTMSDPQVQGRGRVLLPEGYTTSNLQLVGSQDFDNGGVLVSYRAAPTS